MMCKVKCPGCGASYRVNIDRLGNQGATVKCQVCSHQWLLELQALVNGAYDAGE